MTAPTIDGWITTDKAQALSGYNRAYVRWLANHGKVEAFKVGRDWLINQESLLMHITEMNSLGEQKHNPWRRDLAQRGRGRQR